MILSHILITIFYLHCQCYTVESVFFSFLEIYLTTLILLDSPLRRINFLSSLSVFAAVLISKEDPECEETLKKVKQTKIISKVV